jgi:2-polyprenyl-6-methoxyphenol hydroxylase-like FAD-dependent oxidoreductase
VRAALSDVKPAYTGVTFVELWIDDVDQRHPAIARLIGRGTMFALSGGKGLVAQRNGHGHVRVYAIFQAPAGWMIENGIDPADPARLRDRLKRLFAGWNPQLLSLIDRALDVAFVRPIVALPAAFRWAHRLGVTIIGDAAHVMPPVGVGVNLAMLDAAELASALAKDADWNSVMARFEALMQDRAAEYAVEAAEGFAEMYADDAPRAVLHHMQTRGVPQAEPTADQ